MKQNKMLLPKSIYTLIQKLLGTYLNKRFNISVSYKDMESLNAPYIILGNHTNNWDPFFVATQISDPIHFVTSDEYFRNSILRYALKLVGAIPKTKFLSDFDTVKQITQVKTNNGVIGIFPEGKRNWNGTTDRILYPTAKLIKLLKIPVVTGVLKGAYLSYPRWATHGRKGRIDIQFQTILSSDDIKSASVDHIYNELKNALYHKESQYQREQMIPFRGSRLAEKVELYLFACPHCSSIGSMESYHSMFFCNKCGYEVRYNEYGFFEQIQESFYFDTCEQWDHWQLDFLQTTLDPSSADPSAQALLEDGGVFLFRGRKRLPLKKINLGHLFLYKNRLLYQTTLHKDFFFDLKKIHGINIQYNNKVEFYYEDALYRFVFKNPHTSAYKWSKALEYLKAYSIEKKNVASAQKEQSQKSLIS